MVFKYKFQSALLIAISVILFALIIKIIFLNQDKNKVKAVEDGKRIIIPFAEIKEKYNKRTNE